MGTRNLTIVVQDKKVKVAQYGQWDGYPSGQGMEIVEFLKAVNLETFKEKVRACQWLNNEEEKALEEEWEGLKTLLPKDYDKQFYKEYPELTRDTAAEILGLIAFGKATKLRNGIEFATDSLFCEWAYVLDLDTDTLEIYKGFNYEPLTEDDRFFYLQNLEKIEENSKKQSMEIPSITPSKLWTQCLSVR